MMDDVYFKSMIIKISTKFLAFPLFNIQPHKIHWMRISEILIVMPKITR